jgi:hypothetical protein
MLTAGKERQILSVISIFKSNYSFAFAALAKHTHTHTFGQSFLFIQHSVLRHPDVDCKSWCRRQNRKCMWVLQRIGYTECWCGAAVPAWSVKGNSLRLEPWEAQGAARSFGCAWLWWGNAFPVVAALIHGVILGNQVCAAVIDYATAPLQFGSCNKWKELMAKRGCDLFSWTKLALARPNEAEPADCLTGVLVR